MVAILATCGCHPSGSSVKDKSPNQVAKESLDTVPGDPDASVIDGNDPRPFKVVTEQDSAKAKRRAEEARRKREFDNTYKPGKEEIKPQNPLK